MQSFAVYIAITIMIEPIITQDVDNTNTWIVIDIITPIYINPLYRD